MKKTTSVDFSSLRSSRRNFDRDDDQKMASQFSLRAARGSFSSELYLLDEETRRSSTMQSLKSNDGFTFTRSEIAKPLKVDSKKTSSPFHSLHKDIDPKRKVSETFKRLVPQIIFFILVIGSMTSQLKNKGSSTRAPAMTLGSAAVSSVTDALSPILPFAGGLDLRRKDYQFWSNTDWWGSFKDVATQIRDAFTTEGKSDTASKVSVHESRRGIVQIIQVKHAPVLAGQETFMPLETVAAMTLGDVAETFRYAVESSRSDFSHARFMKRSSERAKIVVEILQSAVDKSTTTAAEGCVSSVGGHDEVDAFKFAAAMRVFAEWRLLRQVPDGYKGYAVGMSLGHKDVVQNVAKIEHAAQKWLATQEAAREAEGGKNALVCPTLRNLLNTEIELELHPSLPRLKEKSSAMGLLWVTRQLLYQTRIFENVKHVPSRFETARDAVAAAYKQVYDKYHGWAVQKIFNYSFQAAPNHVVIFRHMNPHKMAEARAEAFEIFTQTEDAREETPNTGSVTAVIVQERPISENPVVSFFLHIGGEWDRLIHHLGGEWDKFTHHVGGEWEKLATNVVRIFNPNHKQRKTSPSLGKGVELSDEMERYVSKAMSDDAHMQIDAYLKVVDPLLSNLETLLNNLNMNDPTKV